MAVSIQIAKFKLRQYEWRAISPNLMLAKVSRYTVADKRDKQKTLLKELHKRRQANLTW